MIDKTKIIEYIDMLVLNRKKEKPYYDLCGGEMLLYDIIWDTEVFAGKALGIPEDTITQFIMDYAWNGYIILDGKLLMTSEEIADCIIKDSAT